MHRKGVEAVVAIVLLLMMTVSAAGIAYVWTSSIQKDVQETGTAQTQKLVEQASSCMSIDSVSGRNVYLRNCGDGTITGSSVLVYIDGIPANGSLSPAAISEGDLGIITLSGIWNLAYGKHTLKVTNGQADVSKNVVAEVNTNGLVGYWTFDEGAGTVAGDSSGNVNIGTIVDNEGDQWVEGKFIKALNFDSIDDRVEIRGSQPSIENVTDDGNSFTFQIWFKPSGLPQSTNDGYIFFRTGQHEGIYHSKASGELRAIVWYNDGTNLPISTGINLQTGTWYHLTMTVDEINNQFKLYMDGKQVGSTATITKPLRDYASATYYVGGGGAGNTYRAYGAADDIKLYSKVVTPDDVIYLRGA